MSSASTRRLGDAIPDGLEHVCFGTDRNLFVSEIWDSREQFEAFGERLLPILAAAGIDPGRIDIYEVHAVQNREAAEPDRRVSAQGRHGGPARTAVASRRQARIRGQHRSGRTPAGDDSGTRGARAG
ncbi:MAG: hypothetical protein U0R69_13535 [Gaiellales bacterium]